MKKIQLLGLIILAAGIFTSACGAEFSDKFAKILLHALNILKMQAVLQE